LVIVIVLIYYLTNNFYLGTKNTKARAKGKVNPKTDILLRKPFSILKREVQVEYNGELRMGFIMNYDESLSHWEINFPNFSTAESEYHTTLDITQVQKAMDAAEIFRNLCNYNFSQTIGLNNKENLTTKTKTKRTNNKTTKK
jgi:hypothetical protein